MAKSKKKKATEMTTEELAHRLLPPSVLKKAKEIVRELNDNPKKKDG
jgi:hypothetical protein